MKILRKILSWVLIIIFIYFIYFSFIVSHEAIHSQIFNRYGIRNDINFKFLPIPRGVVTPYGNYTLCNDSCKLQHSLNDIVGYNLVILLLFLTGVLFLSKIRIRRKTKWK